MNKRFLALLTAIVPVFAAVPAQAACGWLDPTCDSGPGDCLFGACPSGGDGGSEIQVVTPATYYQFEIRNATNGTVYYSINGQHYSLPPGYHQSYRYPRTSGSSSGGSIGTRYNAVISWDGQYTTGYQARNFTLPFSNYDGWYEFRTSGGEIYIY